MADSAKLKVKMTRVLDVPEDQLKEYQEAFNLFDKGRTGLIGVPEIYKAMKNFGYEIPKNEIQKMVTTIDSTGDGKLNFEEFVSFIQRSYQKMGEEEALLAAFRTFDRNKDGYIGSEEFKFVLGKLGRKLDDKTVNEIIKESGIEEDGKVNYKEWIDFWKAI